MTKQVVVCDYDDKRRCIAETCVMESCPDAEGLERGAEFVVVDRTIETEVRI